ncbi:hypothetical protein [Arthrobacter sp. 24S4-2]|uniref:hypothetical protein n=1 Tax=Arthrobacter sp. 24S4-2 TaxID=2575374 RepID=UPI001586C005|nr:hypothetical protein [Arthrobacter sp. 24S4-2]
MITSIETGCIFLVTGDRPVTIEQGLNAAEEAARNQAIRAGKHGVLVTRHGPATFAVAVSAEVPYGLTQERGQCEAERGAECIYCTVPETDPHV